MFPCTWRILNGIAKRGPGLSPGFYANPTIGVGSGWSCTIRRSHGLPAVFHGAFLEYFERCVAQALASPLSFTIRFLPQAPAGEIGSALQFNCP
jgi:hypothetical protein